MKKNHSFITAVSKSAFFFYSMYQHETVRLSVTYVVITMMGLRFRMKGSAGPSKSIRSDVTGLAFTSANLHSVSVRLAISAERLVVEVLVGVGTVELWGSGGLTLKGLLGTLIPPQVMATVCLIAEVGVYEQEYTPSPLLFTLTSMGSPSAFWRKTKH